MIETEELDGFEQRCQPTRCEPIWYRSDNKHGNETD